MFSNGVPVRRRIEHLRTRRSDRLVGVALAMTAFALLSAVLRRLLPAGELALANRWLRV
jgi:hypothetical protein